MNLNARAILMIVAAAIAGALLGSGVGAFLASTAKPYFRAEIELAMLPGPNVPADEISNYWEALSRGQAPRIAAEVLNQRRWRDAAAAAAGVSVESVGVSAGVVTDTTLITVGAEAPSAAGAEAAVTAAVAEATPLAQSVSGPFVLQIVQPAEGTAKSLTTSGGQTIAVAALAGLIAGAGLGFLFVRRRPAAAARPGGSGGSGGSGGAAQRVQSAPIRSAPPQGRPGGPQRPAMPAAGPGPLRPGAAPVPQRPDR